MKRFIVKNLLPVILAIAVITVNVQSLYAFFSPDSAGGKQVMQTTEITGELKKWHKITLTFTGPQASETGTPNPFLDYRLDVTFTHSSGKVYKVPGYYAADGNAAETGATSGNKWRTHFSPDLIGNWSYKVSMRQGAAIAVSDVVFEGSAVSGVDGLAGSIVIAASDKAGVDFRAKGRLKYTGASFLQFAETGEYFRKTGADAPENFLAYNDFDNTSNYNNYRKSWSPHIMDWTSGDPTWKSGLGKGIIGAVNYLSSVGMNTFSFLTMNIRGDDRNVWPYVDTAMRTRMDVSKLDQWEILFDHAQQKGMHLHFKTQETENCKLLDGGAVGTERKLYYRELIARFGHHLALSWNLGEENVQTTQQQKDMSQYFWNHDPYQHNIDLHTFPNQQETYYRPLIGSASNLTGVSIQTDISNVYTESRKWVEASALSGKKWIVANDEQGSAAVGVAADAEYTGKRGTVADNSEQVRRAVLWGNLMAGGAGAEYYFGYNTGETDLSCQDFRSRAKSWRYAKIAQDFFHNYLPFAELKPLSNTSAGWSLGNDSINVVYLSAGGTASVSLRQNNYNVKWYNPRSGGSLQNGTVTNVGSGTVSIGYPPSDVSSDWIALIVKTTASGSSLSPSSYRINSGGPALTNSIGTFAADGYYSSGNTYSTTSSISGTTNGTMYQTERFGANGTFNYAFPISNGSYKVILHFAELYWTAAGKRIFDVNIEGAKVLDNYDIFRKVGALAATSETFTVNVSDGTLNINFSSLATDGGIDQPKVSAIEIISGATITGISNPSVTTSPSLSSFTLINASNNQDLQIINNGATLNLATLGKSLNIRANTSPSTVGSVVFNLSGVESRTQTETTAPYALFGDNAGVFKAWTPSVGSYTLKASPYTGSTGSGTAGVALSINFSIVNQTTITRIVAIPPTEKMIAKPVFRTVKAFPNPGSDGHYTITLPSDFDGKISYTLSSLSGMILSRGYVLVEKFTGLLSFDFSKEMNSSGIYYLKLEGKDLNEQLKLIQIK